MGHLEDRAGLEGRVAVVAGGAAGLGRASALELGRAGMALAVCDRDSDRLAELETLLTSEGVPVFSRVLDVRDADALGQFVASVGERHGGRIDVLVNVVGGTFHQPFVESNAKGWDALIRTNFVWLLTAIQLAVPLLRAAGGGSIINLTSIEAHRAAPNYAVYGAMKAAVAALGRSLAVELAPERIRVNAIAPDFVPTEGMAGAGSGAPSAADGASADVTSERIAIPMGRRGTYEDVGGCVLFLASDLSTFVTGQTLHPDGGVLAASGWFRWPDAGWLPGPPPGVVESYNRGDVTSLG